MSTNSIFLPIRNILMFLMLSFMMANKGNSQSVCREPDSMKIVKNGIKAMTVYEYNYSELKRTPSHKYYYKHFDRDGRVTAKNEYSPGRSPYQTKFNYNDAGNLTAELTFDPYEQTYYKVSYRYDAAGNPVEKTHFDVFGRVEYKNVLKYDDAGKPMEEGVFDLAVKLSSRDVFSYNEEGKLTEDRMFYTDGKMAYRVAYNYDEKGRCSEVVRYSAKDSSISTKWAYQYDIDNNMIEEVTIDRNGEAMDRFTFKYDKKGDVKEQVYYYPANTPRLKYTFKYSFYKKK
ncbi:MAG: hypothetical protein NTX03_15200 [Bacteroidetes bacterium]|nr:hypothetical protein [Bacteroidota bacterium]